MVTYGFYNSVDHDRTYDAMQVSELFDGLIREGVYEFIGERFMVRALSGFQVSVGTGRAWYKHTWTKNDATLVLTLPAPPTLPDRYRSDAIVLDINSDIKVRENKITYIKGEESADSNPPHPTLASGTHHQVPLAYIKRVGREEEILQTNINYVVGQSPCPFVVSVIEQIDITDQVAQWNNAWDEWFSNKQGIVETDISNFESVVSSATTEVNNDKAAFKAYVTEQVSEFTIWMSDKKDSFDTWFANLQYILDGDVAGHLQNEIDSLTTRITPIEYGGTGNADGYIRTGFKDAESTLGEFATSEGMNTVASGKSSHAEGGGNYTYVHQDNHFEGEDMLSNIYTEDPFSSDNIYVDYSFTDTLPQGREYKTAKGSQITIYPSGILHESTFTGFNGIHIGYIFKDETEDKILYHGEGSIGSNSYNLDDYIGTKGCRINTVSGNDELDYASFSDADYAYPDVWKYIGTDGVCLDKFVPIDFYIDLPWTGEMTRSGSTITNPKSTITGDPIPSYSEPLNAKSYIIIDIVTGELIAVGQYKESPYNCFEAPCVYGQQAIVHELPSLYFDIDYVTQSRDDITINSDYSYSLTYYNNNYKHHKYRMLFSNQTISEIRPDWDDTQMRIWSPSVMLIENNGSSSGSNYIEINAGETRYYGKTGHTYSMKIFLTYSFDNEDDKPLTWVPEGDYINITGVGTKAVGNYSHAEGYRTVADGDGSHTEGRNTTTESAASHAEGQSTTAGNNFYNTYGDHAEGFQTIATSKIGTVVGAAGAHAEGHTTQALAGGAHAEGYNTIASGEGSHAGGIGAIAYFTGQFVHGTFGFGGYLEVIDSQDKTYNLPDGVNTFNGGLFLMKNSTSDIKTLNIQMTKHNTGEYLLERSRALWLMIIKDVPVDSQSMSYIGMFFIKYDKYPHSSGTFPSIIPIMENGTSNNFEFGTPISDVHNDNILLKAKAGSSAFERTFETNIFRIM